MDVFGHAASIPWAERAEMGKFACASVVGAVGVLSNANVGSKHQYPHDPRSRDRFCEEF